MTLRRFAALAIIFGIIAGVLLVREFWFVVERACERVVSLVAFLCFAAPTIWGAGRSAAPTERKGKAPYVRVSSIPNADFCDNLENLRSYLRTAPRRSQLGARLGRLDRARALAIEKRGKNDYTGSIRANICVVNYIMREIRKYVEIVKRTRSHTITRQARDWRPPRAAPFSDSRFAINSVFGAGDCTSSPLKRKRRGKRMLVKRVIPCLDVNGGRVVKAPIFKPPRRGRPRRDCATL